MQQMTGLLIDAYFSATKITWLLDLVGWQLPAGTSYALEGSVFMGGATIQWLRDGLGIINAAPEVERSRWRSGDNSTTRETRLAQG